MALNKRVSVFLAEAVNSIYFEQCYKKAGYASSFLLAKPVFITKQVTTITIKSLF
jgi:hypothetical protein